MHGKKLVGDARFAVQVFDCGSSMLAGARHLARAAPDAFVVSALGHSRWLCVQPRHSSGTLPLAVCVCVCSQVFSFEADPDLMERVSPLWLGQFA